MDGNKSVTVPFRPKARLIHLLGENLLRDEVTALLELVKNAYDADSPDCKVTFEGIDQEEARIIIKDNGTGMDVSTITTAWTEPGTSFKVRKPVTPKGRRVQGEKGIGRFAVDKLARRLDLYTKTEGMTDVIHFVVDWAEFDNPDMYLEDVRASYIFEKMAFRKKGTTLVLSKLRKKWTYEDIDNVRYGLVRLVPPSKSIDGLPLPSKYADDFIINLEIPLYPSLCGLIRNNIIERAPFRISATLENGELNAMIHRNIPQQKGTISKKIIVQDSRVEVPVEKLRALGPVEIDVGAFLRTRNRGRPKETLFPSISISEEDAKTLEQWHGVSIYSDGFWIYPYGENWFDWLGLASRRVQSPGKKFDNDQIVGFVKISRDKNPGLIQQINREGLVHNERYQTLTAVVLSTLAVLEADAVASGARKRTKETNGQEIIAKSVPEMVEESLGQAQKTIVQSIEQVRDGSPDAGVAALKNAAAEMHSLLTEIRKDFIIYERHAILGMFVDFVIHEINAAVGDLRLGLDSMKNHLSSAQIGLSSKEILISDLTDLDNDLETLVNHVHRWSPFVKIDENKKPISLDQYIQEFKSNFEKKYPELKIEINCEKPIVIEVAETYLHSILQNLVDNAGYWTASKSTPLLKITITENSGMAIIRVSDNGPGIRAEDLNNVFVPGWSLKPNGYGIGLKLAGEAAYVLGGTLALIAKSEIESGATFELRLPMVGNHGN